MANQIPFGNPSVGCGMPPSPGKPYTSSDIAKDLAHAGLPIASVRKPLLSDLEDSLTEAKNRVVTIYDLVDSLENILFGSGGVKGECLKAPEPARSLETLVNKSGDHAANLASLAIRLENLIARL